MLGLHQFKNPKLQGDAGLGLAIAWFVCNGYHVSIPLTDSQDYDLIVDLEGKLYKVQVRTSYHEVYPGIYQLNLLVSGGNRSGNGKIKYFDPSRFDYIFAITDSGKYYLIPSEKITNKKCINLGGEKYEEFQIN